MYNPNKTKGSLVVGQKIAKLAIAFDFACFGCNREFAGYKDFQIDHIIPQIAFREHGLKVDNSFENLCILCPTCNAKKGSKSAADFFGRENMMRLYETQLKAYAVDAELLKSTCIAWAFESKQFAKDVKSVLQKAGQLKAVTQYWAAQ